MADLHRLLKEGALLRAGKVPPVETYGGAIARVKLEHLDWEHIDGLLTEKRVGARRSRGEALDDMAAMREDLLEAAVELLELAGSIDVTARRVA